MHFSLSFYLGFSLEAQRASMCLVVKLVIGVHDSAQVDAANLLGGAFTLQVVEQAVDDATHAALVFQIVHIFWRKGEKTLSNKGQQKERKHVEVTKKNGTQLIFQLELVQYGLSILTIMAFFYNKKQTKKIN